MNNLKFIKWAVLGLATSASPIVNAVSGITITGELIGKMPEVVLPVVDEAVANVKSISFRASQGSNAGCALTTSETSAKEHIQKSGDMLCLFEWVLPEGLSEYGGEVGGYFAYSGNQNVSYNVSIFSGPTQDKILVESGSMSVSVAQATLPSITNYTTSVTSGLKYGNSVTSYNRGDILKTIAIGVDPKPYDQRLLIKGVGSCEVLEGADNCVINTSGTQISDSDEVTGLVTYEVEADALNGYFATAEGPTTDVFDLGWNYESPTVSQYDMQAVSPGNEKIINIDVDGQTLFVNNEKAILVVESPHADLDGTWWHPVAHLKLKPDPQYRPQLPTYEMGGEDMIGVEDMISLPTGEMQLNPVNTSRIGNKFVFEYALSGVPDGVYFPIINVKDSYGNAWEGEVLDSTPLDRYPPEVRIFTTSGRALSASDPVYFFDEIIVAAVDSMSGAGDVLSATVNGADILGESVSEGYDFLKRLQSADNVIDPNQDLTISVVVQDKAGNKSVTELPVRYMPVSWTLDDRSATYKRGVQKIAFPLRQRTGPGCNIYESLNVARSASTNYTYRCGIEWVNSPSGTSGSWDRRMQNLMGAFTKSNDETNTNSAYYNVWMINKQGVESIAYRGDQAFDVQEPDAPLLSVNTYREFLPGVFQTGVEGGYITSTTVEFDNGDLRYEIDTDGSNTLYEYMQTGFVAKKSRMSRTLSVDAAPLWTDRDIKLKATFMGDQSVNSEKSLRVIHTPSLAITADFKSGQVVQTNSYVVPSELSVGIRDLRTRDIRFDRETMGDWTARLATETRNRDGTYEYNYLSDAIDVDDDGKVTFDIDLTPYAMGGLRFLTLVESKSPIPEYSRTIKSNKVFFQVYKGSEIDGEAQIRRVAGKAPFAVQMLFMPDSHEDRVAKGNVNWEMSQDEGATWHSIAEEKDYVVKVLNDEGLYQFRAHVTNKYTGEQRYTEYQEALVYSLPKLSIDGSQALHPDESTLISLFDHDDPADTNEAVVQWSFDNGQTWEDGQNSKSITMGEEVIRLQVRMAYLGTELAETKRWSYIKHNIRKARPLPVRIIFYQPRMMEKGVSYSLEPQIRLVDRGTPTDVKGKWKLPNGDFVDELTIDYIPDAEDVSRQNGFFEFHAWAEGYYAETLSIKKFAVKMWEYNFPTYEISGGARTTYAPASGAVIIPVPNDLPPSQSGIKFETVWSLPSEIEVIRQTERLVVFNVTKAGQHQVTAAISDNRGNSKSVMMFIGVTEPPEPDMTIVPRYSNNVMREPLIVTARLNGKLGHPLDRISRIEWEVDGVLQEQIGGTIMIRDIMAGEHDITAKMTTKYGVYRDYKFPISVVPNIAPTCDVEEKAYSSIIRLEVQCVDLDGRIARYEWELNGEVLPYSGGYINVSKTAGHVNRVVVRGMDDSGAFSNSIERIYSY